MDDAIYMLLVFFLLINIYQYFKIKKAKKEMELYKSILDTLPVVVFVHRKLHFLFANKTGGKILGIDDPQELLGKPVSDYIQLNIEAIGEERIKNAMEDKPFEVLIEDKLTRIDGEVAAVEVVSMPMELDDKIVVLNLSRDIKQREELEKLKRKVDEEKERLREVMEYDKLRTEFFSNLSHELRTPLTLILGVINLLEGNLKEGNEGNININNVIKVDKKIKILRQNCYRLLRLVNNLIDMTKLDAGYFELEFQRCNIVNLVEEITMSCIEYIENRGIDIEFDTEIEEKYIACDPEKVERVILNILSNAIKFTPKGGKITVNIRDNGDEVLIHIRDTGIGIPQEKLDIIFERFMQIDKSFTRSHEGSGIGLSLVKSLVEMHKGSIKVESEYGKGSEFIICFPVNLLQDTQDTYTHQKDIKNENYVDRIDIEFADIYS
ncbi:PAS domain-containing sensor histidine kinase [Alkaliphilus hydrothermalis]|uniref:histidine kinase n=1 Tax=Alkaliphilus hydrothermalis TaxID=1482730 RepID=A0ABS2NS33_9FIRM|nr:ATP-binding protein [Alkaliphilus hydrothermalis]MBM7615748.1 PAS domain S-box-containing protein [Alkaliphilus hydrothermalis]